MKRPVEYDRGAYFVGRKSKWIDFSENYVYNILSGNFQISLIITSKEYILLADRYLFSSLYKYPCVYFQEQEYYR
ncbi:hypothetical protein [Lysinibacillus sp. NPDC093692]|uniref:hypothetical protein n=1 Tax=Lysinibacillus sp. NPDC093692 TaxID=3390578 RepID=UPI003D0112F7